MPQCPKCAQEIPADAPGGLCPSCAIRGAIDPSDAGLAPTTMAKTPVNDEFAAPTAEELTALLPQFRVEAELGRGGMGVVYRGVQLNLERSVAIKLLAPHLAADPAFAERFTREARALARMTHPNIVAVYDFGRDWAVLLPCRWNSLMGPICDTSCSKAASSPSRPWRSCRKSATPCSTPTTRASSTATSSPRISSWTSGAA